MTKNSLAAFSPIEFLEVPNNLLHYNGVAADSPTIQYILSRNPATGGYTLTHASAPALGYKVTADTSTKRVYLHSEDDPSKQEWLIIPHIFGYRLVLRSDIQYALTAVGSSSGYNDDLTITTDGHVILKKFTGTLEFNMMWVINKRYDYCEDVISLGWHITGNKCEVVFTVKETTTFNIKTYSTNQTGDHATVTSLYTHGTSTLLSSSTSLGDLTTGNINYEKPVTQSAIERSSITNVQLTKGIPYKLVVEQYESTAPLDFYLIISQTNYTDYYFNCKNYSVLDIDTSFLDMDAVESDVLLPGAELAEKIKYSFACIDYAFAAYDNYYYNEQFLYNVYKNDSSNPIHDIGYYNNDDRKEPLIEEFEAAGFVQLDEYEPTCIIVYWGSHYAVSIEGIITAKLGSDDLVLHKGYSIYYDENPVLFFARP